MSLPPLGEEECLRLMTFVAELADAGKRLDRFLAQSMPDTSRARIQQWIRDGRVRVGSGSAKASAKLKVGEVISVSPAPAKLLRAEPENIPLDILHEDEDLVAINKPAGMVVHAGAGCSEGTLVNALLHHFGMLSSVGGYLRPGIVSSVGPFHKRCDSRREARRGSSCSGPAVPEPQGAQDLSGVGSRESGGACGSRTDRGGRGCAVASVGDADCARQPSACSHGRPTTGARRSNGLPGPEGPRSGFRWSNFASLRGVRIRFGFTCRQSDTRWWAIDSMGRLVPPP